MSTNKYDWTEFYTEFAVKLLGYRDRRQELVEKVYEAFADIDVNMPKLENDGVAVDDIDPLTVFSLFNRNYTDENRRIIITELKRIFGVVAHVPESFDGIPTVNFMNATFYPFEKEDKDKATCIDNIWKLYELVLSKAHKGSSEDREEFSHWFDIVINQPMIARAKLTSALYWLSPTDTVNVDGPNEYYIYSSGMVPREVREKLPAVENIISGEDYLIINDTINEYVANSPEFDSVMDFSHTAYVYGCDKEYFTEFIRRFLSEYLVEREQEYKDNNLKKYINSTATKNISHTGIIDFSQYVVRGGAGGKTWAEIPWIAVFNKDVTDSVQKGAYIMYLLSVDGKSMYLTFNMGGGLWASKLGQEKAVARLRENAKFVLERIDGLDFSDEPIDLGALEDELAQRYEAGCSYSRKYTLEDLPTEAELREDLVKMVDIYEEYIRLSSEKTHEGWWPPLEEFNPGLSKEDWMEYLRKVEKPEDSKALKMLKGMMELKGEASCKQLADEYGGSVSRYNGITRGLGERVKNYFKLEPCFDGDQERFFPFPFLGKYNDNPDERLFVYKLRPELKKALEELKDSMLKDVDPRFDEEKEQTDIGMDKNLILCGPPGTGKTYNTAIYAVAICDGRDPEDVSSQDYGKTMKRYSALKEEGRIEFTTFHQSYGYEEFIEGIRPVMNRSDEEDAELRYDITSGVFKSFCERASQPVLKKEKRDLGLNKSPSVWKVSLEGTYDNPTRKECMDNGHIRVGYDTYGRDITDDTDFTEGGKNVLNAFIYRMKEGDIVLSCYSSSTIDAVGIVTGEYEWHDEYDEYKRLRKVKWLVKGINENIVDINNGATMTLSSVYKMNITAAEAMEIVNKYTTIYEEDKDKNQKYVFIIDEINRGNISKIFGELITLIEESKRVGVDNEEKMTAKLPYSGENFGIPDNVYIIGTMNTADRSIAVIDTALRRRFSFREMMPDSSVLAGIEVEGVSIAELLDTMNRRIEVLYDREHTIGHSYFMPLQENPNVETLADIFRNNIIPLLQEYFYEDYEKIRMVLGDNREDKTVKFIRAREIDYAELFGESDYGFEEANTYEINAEAFANIEAYRQIVECSNGEDLSDN